MILIVIFVAGLAAQTTVANLEDPKAMGYPDSRKIVRDSVGDLYVAYRKKNGGAYQIYVARSSNNGSTWSVTNGGSPISTITGSCNQRVPSLAIDSVNTLHLVWYGLDSGCISTSNARQIKYSHSTNSGNTWSATTNIATVSGYTDTYIYNGTTYSQEYWQEHPVIYIDANDALYVVWEGRDAINVRTGQIKFVRSIDGGASWSSWKNIAQISASQSRPTMVIDTSGKIFVFAYSKLPGTSQINIVQSTSNDGGTTFSTWSAVSADNNFEQRHVSAAIDSGNKIHLVWRQEDSTSNGRTVIKYSKFTNPTWSIPVSIAPASGQYQFFPSITNKNGSQFVVWTETPDESGYITDSGSEEPTTGKIVAGKKMQGTTSWTRSDLTSFGSNTWASIRWSSNTMNGSSIDVVYSSGSSDPYQLKYTAISTGTASITGRVAGNGRNIADVRLELTDALNGSVVSARSNHSGYFTFPSIDIGRPFTIRSYSKRFTFDPINFVAIDGSMILDIFAR